MRFFHRTHECYVVAEGSFAGRFASIEAISDLADYHIDFGQQSGQSDSETGDVTSEYDDTQFHEQPRHTLCSHTQQVEVEIHESSDRVDSEHECVPTSSICSSSYKLGKAESIFGTDQSSLKVSDQVATMKKIPSISLDLADEGYQQIVTDNSKQCYYVACMLALHVWQLVQRMYSNFKPCTA